VYVNSRSSIEVISSSFINNTAVRQGGGAVYLNECHANIYITIFSSIFSYNLASYCSVLDRIDEFDHYACIVTVLISPTVCSLTIMQQDKVLEKVWRVS
jgi:predicted outer membrane repeat protein